MIAVREMYETGSVDSLLVKAYPDGVDDDSGGCACGYQLRGGQRWRWGLLSTGVNIGGKKVFSDDVAEPLKHFDHCILFK